MSLFLVIIADFQILDYWFYVWGVRLLSLVSIPKSKRSRVNLVWIEDDEGVFAPKFCGDPQLPMVSHGNHEDVLM